MWPRYPIHYVGTFQCAAKDAESVPHDDDCEADWDPTSRTWSDCDCLRRCYAAWQAKTKTKLETEP